MVNFKMGNVDAYDEVFRGKAKQFVRQDLNGMTEAEKEKRRIEERDRRWVDYWKKKRKAQRPSGQSLIE